MNPDLQLAERNEYGYIIDPLLNVLEKNEADGIRSRMVSYMITNFNMYQELDKARLNTDLPQRIHYESIADRIASMSDPMEHVGEIEIIATTEALGRSIEIYSEHGHVKKYGTLTDDTPLVKFISLDEYVGHYNCLIPEPSEKHAAANSAPEDIKCVVVRGPKYKCVNVIKMSPCDGHITQDDSLIPAGHRKKTMIICYQLYHQHRLICLLDITIPCLIKHDKMDSPTYSHVPLHYVTPAKLYPLPNVIKTRIQRGRQSKSEVLTSSPYKDKLPASKQKKKRVKSTEEKLTEAKTKKNG